MVLGRGWRIGGGKAGGGCRLVVEGEAWRAFPLFFGLWSWRKDYCRKERV